MKQPAPREDTPSYAAAAKELDAILEDIDNGEIDVDQLSEKVERAAHLIRLCREKLAGTELKITKVIAGLDVDAEDSADAEDEPE